MVSVDIIQWDSHIDYPKTVVSVYIVYSSCEMRNRIDWNDKDKDERTL